MKLASITEFNDEHVRLLLCGDRDDIGQALQKIIEHLQNPIYRWLRKKFPGLPSEDLADCWADMLANLFEKVSKNDFDPDRPLRPLIYKIAHSRATDKLRRQTSYQDAMAAVGEMLRNTKVGREWNILDDLLKRDVLNQIQEAIMTLPEKQRIVMQVFVDNYPETKSMESLRFEVGKVTGCEETLASVKRALQEARVKVREFLITRNCEI